ncbi:MAG: head decoration protein, partial [Pseudomonadota bacterium]
MASLSEGNNLGDVLYGEFQDKFSREVVTVESGQDLELAAVVGKRLKVIPTTGTAGANTGDGTLTAVTGGEDTQLGTYTLTCIEVPEGAAVVPATGTAGANTGDGTMTGVADGGASQIGTYTLTCIEVPEGAAVVP